MAGEVVRAHAVANCPVATGRLKGSIVSQVDGDSVAIGPTADYGIFVEFGTGSKGDKSVSHTSKRHWTYYSGGRFYTTSGQALLPNRCPEVVKSISEGERSVTYAENDNDEIFSNYYKRLDPFRKRKGRVPSDVGIQ